jgi:hypothetical protein
MSAVTLFKATQVSMVSDSFIAITRGVAEPVARTGWVKGEVRQSAVQT